MYERVCYAMTKRSNPKPKKAIFPTCWEDSTNEYNTVKSKYIRLENCLLSYYKLIAIVRARYTVTVVYSIRYIYMTECLIQFTATIGRQVGSACFPITIK